MKQQVNFRAAKLTASQLATLVNKTGMNQTEVISVAIDRMYNKEIEMTPVTIPQKMSGTGTIHDLASYQFERDIEFGEDDKYAIVLAAYYGNGNMYYTAKDAAEAVEISKRESEYSHAIIDRDGDEISIEWLERKAGLW